MWIAAGGLCLGPDWPKVRGGVGGLCLLIGAYLVFLPHISSKNIDSFPKGLRILDMQDKCAQTRLTFYFFAEELPGPHPQPAVSEERKKKKWQLALSIQMSWS